MLARDLGHRFLEWWSLGLLSISTTDLAETLILKKQVVSIIESIGHREGQAAAYNNLGVAYCRMGLYRLATHYGERAVEISRARHTSSETLIQLEGPGRAYLAMGDFERAVQRFTDSLALIDEVEGSYQWDRSGRLDRVGPGGPGAGRRH